MARKKSATARQGNPTKRRAATRGERSGGRASEENPGENRDQAAGEGEANGDGGASGDDGESETEKPSSPEAARAESIRTGAYRETTEAFVVAFILALLFRAFIAEAFVIPTGSMAPTLMGAHKEIDCDRCGQRFRIGASSEQRTPVTENVVVGGICPNCRHVNPHDLVGEPNDATFSGDRILVSKFAYTLSEPERWDVIVFKFPGNPKQNYIKRLVGLPNETLTIRSGDVFTRPTASDQADQIVRKPAETLLAMRHLVYDSDHQADALVQAGWPSRLQPWRPEMTQPPTDSWQIERAEEGLVATLSGDPTSPQWLRYYHRWPSDDQWERADKGLSLAGVDPYDSRAITDFYAYNSYILVPAGAVYDVKPSQFGGNRLQRKFGSGWYGGEFKPTYRSGESLNQFSRVSYGGHGTGRDGMHWVGDLMFETDFESVGDAKTLTLELVEAGVKHHCTIDLASGVATLSIEADGQPAGFDPQSPPTAQTEVLAGTRHTIRFSNCDDQLLLWVDDELIDFNRPTTFDGVAIRSFAQDYPRFGGVENPLDAAPIGIAVTGGSATVRRVRIDRDKYYIATKNSDPGVYDYDFRELSRQSRSSMREPQIQKQLGARDQWESSPMWRARREVTFVMDEDQFFPMGDNSPESLDARCWAGSKSYGQPPSVDPYAYHFADAYYVPRDLLVGKALMVFWPHPWNSPVPFTPNLQRMKLIR